MPRRTFWLVTGVAFGAGSTLWAEKKVRHTWEQAAARLQPDALAVEVGRTARQAAGTAGGRLRDAVTSGRSEMLRREEELWSELAAQGGVESDLPIARHPMSGYSTAAGHLHRRSAPIGARPAPALPLPPATAATTPPRAPGSRRPKKVRLRPRREKSPSYLGK
jgi:hypothetical protein